MNNLIKEYTIENVKDMNGKNEVNYFRIKLNDNLYYGGYDPKHVITSKLGYESRIQEKKYAEYFVMILKEYYDQHGKRNNKEVSEKHNTEIYFA